MNNRFLMSYEYNKVMNEFKGANWMKRKKADEEEDGGNCLVNTLFFAYGVYYYNMLHVYLNMGLPLEIYMSNAILMTHHLSSHTVSCYLHLLFGRR